MKTKYLISIAAAMLFTLASLATHAQDMYEYATIVVNNYGSISASYSNGEFENVPLDKTKESKGTAYDQRNALAYIAKLSSQGWELIGFAPGGADTSYWRYLLKRKVK